MILKIPAFLILVLFRYLPLNHQSGIDCTIGKHHIIFNLYIGRRQRSHTIANDHRRPL